MNHPSDKRHVKQIYMCQPDVSSFANSSIQSTASFTETLKLLQITTIIKKTKTQIDKYLFYKKCREIFATFYLLFIVHILNKHPNDL